MTSVSEDDIRHLPLPDLALRLLGSLSREQANFNNLIQGYKQRGGYGASQPQDLGLLLARLADAWAWLEAHGLIGPSAQNSTGAWRRITAMGQEALDDPNAVQKVWAAERLAGHLHSAEIDGPRVRGPRYKVLG